MTATLRRHAGSAILAGGLGLVAILALSGTVNTYFLYVANLTMTRAIAAIGLIILSGVAGQLSLGTAALLGIGAYATGICMVHLGMGYVVAALCGAAVTALIGTALAAPALRLTGLHLAIVTLAFGVIVVQLIGKGGKLTGGMSGLFLPQPTIFGWALDTEPRRFIAIGLSFLVVTLTSMNFLRLKPGRALFALRAREITAQSLGINTSGYKILAFAYCSFLAGLSGALYAALKGYISVDDFTLWDSLYFFVMIAIGGMTSIAGGIVGAVVITVLPEVLSGFQGGAQAVFGIVLLLVVLFIPGGIVQLWRRGTAWAFPPSARPQTAAPD